MGATAMDGRRILSATWFSQDRGKVELARDWKCEIAPPLFAASTREPLSELSPVTPADFGLSSGYSADNQWITFIADPERYPHIDWENETLYVSGDFNGWGRSAGSEAWKLAPAEIDGRPVLALNMQRERCLEAGPVRFKFVTGSGYWLEVLSDAPNAVTDADEIRNFEIHPERTGAHIFTFSSTCGGLIDPAFGILWIDEHGEEFAAVNPGAYHLELETDVPLGAIVDSTGTTFRLFVPIADEVAVHVYDNLERNGARKIPMRQAGLATWEASVSEDLHTRFYHYEIVGPTNPLDNDEGGSREVLDPYALVTVAPTGPGIVWDTARTPAPDVEYCRPALQDLVIVEGHIRDLTARAPIEVSREERVGFVGLRKWVESEDFYVSTLGANALELQPVIQFDLADRYGYHWGYMPTAQFAPHAGYGTAPEAGTQIAELQELVSACHRRGIAVILDVVYNHVGELSHLARIDRRVYFETDLNGEHINWTGTGNTLRCNGPMVRRLIVDSLVHLLRFYRVDGFRFDLAEILGLPVLNEIEVALKAVDPSVILIAEPWSFRGHIGRALKATGYASWNDGFREFLRRYVWGKGNTKGLKYFLSGSPGHLTRSPAQAINYVESHDDRTWIDDITENAVRNGSFPTATDRRRTHLMAAVLMSALGVPMLAAGQDFLRSKHGVRNTYLRGDLNELDYSRAIAFPSSADYFRRWIRFRLSHAGRLFRLESAPSPGYLRFFENDRGSAVAVVYNADFSAGSDRIVFAINPHFEEMSLRLEGVNLADWMQIADHERFDSDGLSTARLRSFGATLILPRLSCGLWSSRAFEN